MQFTPPPTVNYTAPKGMTEADWLVIRSEIQQRWPKWAMTDMDRKDWWAMLSYHPADRVRRALRDVRARYSSEEPKLAWVLKSLQQMPKDDAPAGEATSRQVIDAPPRCEMIADLRRWEWERVVSRATGHWLQRSAVRALDAAVPERPEEWSDLLLTLTWASVLTAQGKDVPGREEAIEEDRSHEDTMSLREFSEGHPGSPLARLLATPARVQEDA